jgi:hypothetical protein
MNLRIKDNSTLNDKNVLKCLMRVVQCNDMVKFQNTFKRNTLKIGSLGNPGDSRGNSW